MNETNTTGKDQPGAKKDPGAKTDRTEKQRPVIIARGRKRIAEPFAAFKKIFQVLILVSFLISPAAAMAADPSTVTYETYGANMVPSQTAYDSFMASYPYVVYERKTIDLVFFGSTSPITINPDNTMTSDTEIHWLNPEDSTGIYSGWQSTNSTLAIHQEPTTDPGTTDPGTTDPEPLPDRDGDGTPDAQDLYPDDPTNTPIVEEEPEPTPQDQLPMTQGQADQLLAMIQPIQWVAVAYFVWTITQLVYRLLGGLFFGGL